MTDTPFIDAPTAAERLGVSRATLYAYVSRGLVRAEPHPTDPRARLYRAADIAALTRRKALQHRPAEAAATTLDWGMPAIVTAISSIADGHLTYRGTDAVDWSRMATLEETAAMLWQGAPPPNETAPDFRPPDWDMLLAHVKHASGLDRAMALLSLPMDDEPPGTAEDRLTTRSGALLRLLAEAVVPRLPAGVTLHEGLARAWGRPDAADTLRRALVLLADHETNASTYAVRVVASTGASLRACLHGGLAALSGPLHGGATARASALVEAVAQAASADKAVRDRLARGESLAGFGHPLYPEGDPRAAELLAHIGPSEATLAIAAVDNAAGLRPNVDMALVAVEKAYELPDGAALDLFTIGRAAGWLAHAIEQRTRGRLIRPRARFVGDSGL
ncbi:MAG: citrate/2-methylcitrate synthase [Novosphingobium sp.]